MSENIFGKVAKAKRKAFPALGGINKNYIKKPACLKTILIFLSDQLYELESSKNINLNEKEKIKKIRNDMKKYQIMER